MADFRRWFYALALVALIAGFTVPASAQAAPFQCTTTTSVPPTLRAEGWTELVGDMTLNCSGGVPTPAGQVVQPVDITVSITTNLTSRLLSGGIWTEALLIIDEPHSAVNPGRAILNCGNSGAPDSGPSGANVCAIVATADPSRTYDGTVNGYGGTGSTSGGTFVGGLCTGSSSTGVPPSAGSYSCGRPNVFQGRLGTAQVAGQLNSVSWLGVPLDPPGTSTNRTIRITNLRANAHSLFIPAAGNFFLSQVQAQISINGNTSLSLSLSTGLQTVAYVAQGLSTGIKTTNFSFLQCVGEHNGATTGSFGVNGSQTTGNSPQFSFTEGFASSFKAKNIAHILNSTTSGYTGNGTVTAAASYWSYTGFSNGANGTVNYPKDFNQNVPGAIYNTESGFMYPGSNATLDSGAIDPSGLSAGQTNPPFGLGTVQVTSTSLALSNSTGIANAGIADAGTRLQVQISNIPAGSVVLVPDAIWLTNGCSVTSTCNSGIAMLVNTDAAGAGSYSPVFTGTSAATAVGTYTQIASTGLAVYEVIFADPFSIESATITAVVSYAPALSLNQPSPTTTAQVFGGFAPFYSSAAASSPSSTLPIPRFAPGTVPANPNFFSINKCACNLLFPFVASTGGFDTGIAIANTSQDNLGPNGLSAALQQFGGVQFWYYGTGNNGGTAPPSQCTNTASPGTCPSNVTATNPIISAGQILTYVLSSGGGSAPVTTGNATGANGLDNRAAGFEGYIIAQAQFQYCHAYAFITALGAGPLSAAVSEGYLGLILDNKSWNCTSAGGLCRTNQNAENLVH